MVFLTFFLGLVTGIHPVEWAVDEPRTTTVELILDGRSVEVLEGPPWRSEVDFGSMITPHELEAVARDAQGRELERIRQWINMPRERAEAELLLAADPEGPEPTARLVWGSVDTEEPDEVRIRFDGVELEVEDPREFALPAFDPTIPHLLQAELRLGPVTTRTQAVLGGGVATEVSGELTALPLVLADGADVPEPGEMDGWIEARGSPARVFAVERPGAEVVLVQDLSWSVQRRLQGLRLAMLETLVTTRRRPTGLKSRDRFRLLFPIPEDRDATIRSLHFPMSPNLWTGQRIETYAQGAALSTGAGGGSRSVAEALPQGLMVGIPANGERPIETEGQRLADAVAVAGLAAAQEKRGRVVLLIAGSEAEDESRSEPANVRAFLADLDVPLVVWSPQPRRVDEGWGDVVPITSHRRLDRAIRDFRAHLDRQIVVWVEGRHLPHHLALTSESRGLRRVSAPGRSRAPIPEAVAAAAEPEDPRGEPALPAEVGTPEVAATGDFLDGPGPESAAAVGSERAATEGESESTAVVGPTRAAPDPLVFDETVEVDLVDLDVVVTERDGAPVRDLDVGSFRVLVDGEPATIEQFEAPVRPERPAAGDESPPSGTSEPTPRARPASLVVYVDLVRLSAIQRSRLVEALTDVFDEDPRPVRVSVVVDDGPVELALAFTDDRAAVLDTLREIAARSPRARPDPEGDIVRDMVTVRREIQDAYAPRDEAAILRGLRQAYAHRDTVENRLLWIAEQRRREVTDLAAGLQRLARGLAGVEGRRAVLYVGNRLSLAPVDALFEQAVEVMADDNPTTAQEASYATRVSGKPEDTRQATLRAEAARFQLTSTVDDLIHDARAAGATFYALTPPTTADAELMTRDIADAPGRRISARLEAIKAAACAAARETGGLCQAGGSDMRRLVDATLDDFDTSYSLAFRLPAQGDAAVDGPTTQREIRVEVDRPGLRVRHRTTVAERSAEERVRDRLIAALALGEEHDALGVDIVPDAPEGADGGRVAVSLSVRIPAERLVLLPLPGGESRGARARLFLVSSDELGRATEIHEVPMRFEIPETRVASGAPTLFEHRVRLELPEGNRTVAVGVWDELGRVGSFLRRRISFVAESE